MLSALSLDLVERDTIDTRCTVVRTTSVVGFLDDINPSDLVPKGVEAKKPVQP
jgi:hypothetical protein